MLQSLHFCIAAWLELIFICFISVTCKNHFFATADSADPIAQFDDEDLEADALPKKAPRRRGGK